VVTPPRVGEGLAVILPWPNEKRVDESPGTQSGPYPVNKLANMAEKRAEGMVERHFAVAQTASFCSSNGEKKGRLGTVHKGPREPGDVRVESGSTGKSAKEKS